ncbi:hypothetical protein [Peribacillus simplex]|uniref:hypothetical protein n=1 Tax=Peribacillus simplex TaxID=1478 RepID=UPI00366C43A8
MAVYRLAHSTSKKSSAESDVETNEVFMYDVNVICEDYYSEQINWKQEDNKNVI